VAARSQPINAWRRPGPIAPIGLGLAAGLLALAGAAMAALLLVAGDSQGTTAGHVVSRIALFTAFQAALSAALALALALPTARACWRRGRSWRTDWLLGFCFLPVVMPTTVAATGLIGVWGQKGFVSTLCEYLGFSGLPPIYGLQAVLLAHVFFNAPLMLRVLVGALAGVPAAQWRQSAQWGLSGWQRFRLIEWPAMRRVVPGLLALVFLVCFTSFSLILMLGGGPAVTTLEVSIYTALRFDFDMQQAARLAILQILICGAVVITLTRLGGRSWAATPRATDRMRAQRGDDALSVCFDTPVLDSALTLLGAAELVMTLSSSTPQGQIFARLCDVHRDGASTRIAHGMLNLAHRQGPAQPAAMTPDQRFEVTFRLDQTSYVVPEGHRLRLALSTAYFPFVWPSPEPVCLTLHSGCLSLPLHEGGCPDAPEATFGPPEALPGWPGETLRSGSYNRQINSCLASGLVSLTITSDSGRARDPRHGLITDSHASEVWSIHPDDPLSARADITWQQSFERDDLKIDIETGASMTSDKTAFFLTGYIRAFEEGEPVFEKLFDDTIARDNR